MQLATRSVSRKQLDPKRIAAWSGVFLLHVWVLGMMLLPREAILPSLKINPVDIELSEPIELPPPPLPPPVIEVPPPPVTLQVMAPPPTIAPQAEPAPATTTTEIISSEPNELPVLTPSYVESGSGIVAGNGPGALLTLKRLSGRDPAYPRRELARGIEGDVVLRVLVNAKGQPETIEVLGGSGHRNFELAAIRAVKRWHFQPHTVDGVAQPAWARVPFVFRIGQ